jgi:hypothetical protein
MARKGIVCPSDTGVLTVDQRFISLWSDRFGVVKSARNDLVNDSIPVPFLLPYPASISTIGISPRHIEDKEKIIEFYP